MRIVLDTNVIVSGIFWSGIPYKIIEFWIKDRFSLLISEEILKEYERTLERVSKGKNDNLVAHWLVLIAENAHFLRQKKDSGYLPIRMMTNFWNVRLRGMHRF